MGKRSDFPKIEKDAYMTTDAKAVRPLQVFFGGTNLTRKISYYEPCAGNGDLIRLLGDSFVCDGYSDIEKDARVTEYETTALYFITNPPWTRSILHPIIENLRKQRPTWLLFDADWMFTAQSAPYMKYCRTILPVGRLKWIPDSNNTGKDNCAWYLFVNQETPCTFFPKLPKELKVQSG